MKPCRPLAIAAAATCLLASLSFLSLARRLAVAHPGAVHGVPPAGLPPGFDWRAYVLFNPDLENITSEGAAAAHYARTGHREGRIFRRVPLFLSYNPVWGLCNQLWDHVHLLALAAHLNASLVCPVAYTRDKAAGFSQRFGQFSFVLVPLESLLDLDRMRAYWGERGVHITQTPDTPQCMSGDMSKQINALARNKQNWTVPEAARHVVASFSRLAQPILKDDPTTPLCVRLFLGNPLFFINQRRSLPYMTGAVRGLFFNKTVEHAAGTIRAALAAAGPAYQGVHLRIEKDWGWFVDHNQDLVAGYISVMQSANFNNASACYVASGIFSYESEAEIEALQDRLKREGVCGPLLHQRMLLHPDLIAGLHPEQRALIDLLVLSYAKKLVGDTRSTFSQFAREYRALHGFPKRTFYSVTPGYNLSSDLRIFMPDES